MKATKRNRKALIKLQNKVGNKKVGKSIWAEGLRKTDFVGEHVWSTKNAPR